MRFYKLLSIFFFFSACKAPVDLHFNGLDGARAQIEATSQEWEVFVAHPSEGRSQLREMCRILKISENPKCLEFYFGTLTDPQPAQDGETVVITVTETATIETRKLSPTRIDLSNLEVDMKTSDTSGIVFYLRANDQFLERFSTACCTTYFKDCLADLQTEDLILVRLLFYKDDHKFGGYEENGKNFGNYGIGANFNLKAFNFFRANAEILTEKVLQVFHRYEEMPPAFKEVVFSITWAKILKGPFESVSQYLGDLIISSSAREEWFGFIHHASEALNLLNPIPNHPKLEFSESSTEAEFPELFKSWYEYVAL